MCLKITIISPCARLVAWCTWNTTLCLLNGYGDHGHVSAWFIEFDGLFSWSIYYSSHHIDSQLNYFFQVKHIKSKFPLFTMLNCWTCGCHKVCSVGQPIGNWQAIYSVHLFLSRFAHKFLVFVSKNHVQQWNTGTTCIKNAWVGLQYATASN
jgi:hypothetical protein